MSEYLPISRRGRRGCWSRRCARYSIPLPWLEWEYFPQETRVVAPETIARLRRDRQPRRALPGGDTAARRPAGRDRALGRRLRHDRHPGGDRAWRPGLHHAARRAPAGGGGDHGAPARHHEAHPRQGPHRPHRGMGANPADDGRRTCRADARHGRRRQYRHGLPPARQTLRPRPDAGDGPIHCTGAGGVARRRTGGSRYAPQRVRFRLHQLPA